jgi:CRP-like cAMP-binding protein
MPSLTQVNRPPTADQALKTLLENATGAPLPAWERVQSAMQVRHFETGGTVFLQDVAHPYVYAVRSGLLKLSYLGEEGDEWIKSFAHEGRFFASIAALKPRGRTSFMVTALEPCTVEQLDYRLLNELATTHLPWSRALNALTMVFAARKEQRERELLTLNPESRYIAFKDAYPELERRIPQKDLARHLGLTPVGLNRIAVRVRRRLYG